MFTDACHDWRRRPIIEQTWATFKVDFALAHQELRDSQLTSNQAGYQSANNAHASYDIQQETALAIANLATATASNRSTVASLTSTNSSLSTELTQATAKLTAAATELAALKLEIASLRSASGTGTRQESSYVPNTNYYWTTAIVSAATTPVQAAPKSEKGTKLQPPKKTTWAAPPVANKNDRAGVTVHSIVH
jgi:hypothetical protein